VRRVPAREAEYIHQQPKGIKGRQRGYELVWQETNRAPTTCLESRRPSVGDQCRQAARIVNQDVLVRKALRALFSRLRRSESKPLGVH